MTWWDTCSRSLTVLVWARGFTNGSGKRTCGPYGKHVTSPCQPTQRNYTEPLGWRHVPEDGRTQRTVCPCLAPPFSQYVAHKVPHGPYRTVAGAAREALTSRTLTIPLSWQLSVPQWAVGLNVLFVCLFLLWWCCWCTAGMNHQSRAQYLQAPCSWLRTRPLWVWTLFGSFVMR